MNPEQGGREVPQDDPFQQTQLFGRVPDSSETTALPTTPADSPRRRGGWLRKTLLILLAVVGLLVGYALVLVMIGYTGMDRVDATPDGARPAPAPGQTWLLVGSDSREDLTDEQQGELSTGSDSGRLTDTIMMLTTAPDGVATLISIPRDSLVTIPGYGENKINAAYALGGPKLLVQTVEEATGVRVEGYLEVGFDGFYEIVEAVGGVEVCLDEPMVDERAGIDLPAGCQRLGGADALGYVRSRYVDPEGDLGRVERQREFISALADEIVKPSVLLNPFVAVPLAATAGDALTLDEQTGPIGFARLALTLFRSSGDEGQTLTVPIGSYATTPVAGSVVLWDEVEADELWSAIRNGEPIPPGLLD